MKLLIALSAALLLSFTAWAEQPAKISLNSQTDFAEMSLTLKPSATSNSEYVDVDMILSPEATSRLATVTTQSIGKKLTLYLNGREVSTATVQSPLSSGRFRLSMQKKILAELMPSLLN